MNLLTDYASEITQAMDNVFDSFARGVSVAFYKTPTAVLASFDSSYNADFPDSNSSISYTTQSQSFTCRVWYLDRQEYTTFVEGGEDAGVKGKFYYNRIRLQCKSDGFAYLRDTDRFSLLGEIYQIEEGWERIGAAQSFQVYQVVLKRVN